MPPSSRSKRASPPPDDEDRARAAEATAFAEALNAFEQVEARAAPPPAARRSPSVAPRLGSRVRGRIVSIAADAILLDIGSRSEAVADAREFRDESGVSKVSLGDTLELHVVEVGEPLVLARAARRHGRPSLEALRQARVSGLPVRGKVTAVNTGGLAVDVDGVRAFCPRSQVDEQRIEDVSPYVGRVLEFLVTEVEESRARVVVSRRAFLMQQRSERERERVASLAPGQEHEGTVTRLEPFGVFVDLGGAEGMVHISELSHARVQHPRDVVSAGDRVKVRVLAVEPGRDRRPRVSLSLRATTPDPWAAAAGRFAVGSRVPGVVVRLADFGAFVNLAPGVDGLVHVSQASDRRVQHVRDVLSPGQAVEVVVLAVEPERKRISLSIKDALERPVQSSRVTRAEPRTAAERSARSSASARPPDSAGPTPSTRPTTFARPSTSAEPDALTPMQLAFRKAREQQRHREQGE